MLERIFEVLVSIFSQLTDVRVVLVGGAVIDIIRSHNPKDYDFEIFGCSLATVERVLEANDLPVNLTGKSFGIIKTKVLGEDIDLSVPRRDNKVGKGHRGFEMDFDPTMTYAEAAGRRDLTINTLGIDIVTGTLIDPFNALGDVENGLIRVVDPTSFVEDPLRVLRIMQLYPRKGKHVDGKTIDVCRSIKHTFDEIPGERVFEEFKKLLQKAKKPAKGLRFLERCGWIEHFPELDALRRTPQNREWHPEGSVWNHTLLVLNEAAKLRDSLDEEWRLPFMFAALLHDIGKAVTTTNDLRSPGHDVAGGPLVVSFLERLKASKKLIASVRTLVVSHMAPGQLTFSGAKEGAWRKLNTIAPLKVLGALSKSDSQGRPGHRKRHHVPSELANEFARKFASEPEGPVLMGWHLIQAGYSPGVRFGGALKEAYRYQLSTGCTEVRELLSVALKYL